MGQARAAVDKGKVKAEEAGSQRLITNSTGSGHRHLLGSRCWCSPARVMRPQSRSGRERTAIFGPDKQPDDSLTTGFAVDRGLRPRAIHTDQTALWTPERLLRNGIVKDQLQTKQMQQGGTNTLWYLLPFFTATAFVATARASTQSLSWVELRTGRYKSRPRFVQSISGSKP